MVMAIDGDSDEVKELEQPRSLKASSSSSDSPYATHTRLPWYTLLSDSWPRAVIASVLTFLSLYVIIELPGRLCFDTDFSTLFTRDTRYGSGSSGRIYDAIYDVLMWIELLLMCTIFATEDVHGRLLTTPGDLFRHYRQSTSFWLDIFTLLPADWVVDWSGGSPSLTLLCRLPRLLRIRIIPSAFDRLVAAVRGSNFAVNVNILHLYHLIFWLFLIGHFLACVFYLLGLHSGAPSWMEFDVVVGPHTSEPALVSNNMTAVLTRGSRKIIDLYSRSYLWSFGTLNVVSLRNLLENHILNQDAD